MYFSGNEKQYLALARKQHLSLQGPRDPWRGLTGSWGALVTLLSHGL